MFSWSFRIGNHRLLAFSPDVFPLKVEDLDLVQLSVILVICSFKNKYIFWNTSDFFPYYWRVYICTSLIWFLYVFFHHYMFSPCILVWPIIMVNDIIWSIFLRNITLPTILFISIIRIFVICLSKKNIQVILQHLQE